MPKTNSSDPRGSTFREVRASAQSRARQTPASRGKANRCFCAFCKSPRSIYGKKHISFGDVSLAAIASVLFGWLLWQSFDPRGFMFFGFGLGAAELFVIMRRRFSIACPKCGFDSLLYRKNPQAAVARVKEFRKERFADPLWIFSPPVQPPLTHQPRAPGQGTDAALGTTGGAGNRNLRSPLRDGRSDDRMSDRHDGRAGSGKGRQTASQSSRALDRRL